MEAKIYEIVCNETGEKYIGSTAKNNIKRRLNEHKHTSNGCVSKRIIDRGNYSMKVIETITVETRDEILWRERFHIENNICINKRLPIHSEEEIKNSIKEYKLKFREEHHEEILKQEKEYRDTHKEEIKIKNDNAKESKAKWYTERKEAIAEKNALVIKCECGKDYTHSNKARHLKTKSHLDFFPM
jgi:thiol:disulfide interchange protein